MTEEVKPKGKPGRKPKAVEPKPVVETPKVEEVVSTPQEAPKEPQDEVVSIPEAVDTPKVEDAQETPAEALTAAIVDTFNVATDVATELTTEIVKETEEVKPTEVFVLAEQFKPILRPTNVKGEAIGHMPVPKAIFELVTKDADWRSKVEKHNAKVGLQSVLYWLAKNGKVQVRCMSSSRFGDVL